MSDDNPFQPPKTDTNSQVTGVLSGSREDLRSIAKSQKGILICILVYFIAVFGQFALPPQLRLFLGLGIVLVGVVGAVFVFSLAMKTYGTGLGILLGIFSLVPLVGLLILLAVNSKATNILKENGIKVGLLGANLSSI